MTLTVKLCENCGKEFTFKRGRACSPGCTDVLKGKDRIAAWIKSGDTVKRTSKNSKETRNYRRSLYHIGNTCKNVKYWY